MSKQNFYSATKLADFLKCRHIIYGDFFEKEKNLKKIEISKYQNIRLRKGDEHEDNYLNLLKNIYSNVIDIKTLKFPENDNYENIINLKIDKTIQSMKKGFDVIRGGWLNRDDWRGEIDFLVKNNEINSNLGNYSYDVIDAKNSIKQKPEHIIQLCIYAFLLEGIQGSLPSKLNVALKDENVYEIYTDEIYELFLNFKKEYEIFLKNNLNKSNPEKNSFCNICRWVDECEKIWIKNDDLNQVIGVNKVQKNKLIDLGINTFKELSLQDENTTLDGFTKNTSKKVIIQSKLQKKSSESNENNWEINHENISNYYKGFNLLNKPSKCDLYFDMESVEDHVIDGGLEYLFGVFFIENGKKNFIPFWSHNKKEEKKSLIELFNFFENHFKKYPDSSIYHYNHYEKTALYKLTNIHNVNIEKFDKYLKEKKFVDLYPICRQGIFISESSYSLKNMEVFYDFERKGDIQKADISQEYYVDWTETKENKLLDEIESYNQQDCESTYELHKWLLNIKPTETKWNELYEEDIELNEWDISNQSLREDILNSSIDDDLKQLLHDVVGFYRRENRIAYRNIFERSLKGHDELIDDAECIANMKKSNEEPEIEKSSYLIKYNYEDQDFKRKKLDTVNLVNELDSEGKPYIYAGIITEIDYSTKSVFLKRGMSKENTSPLPEIISIGPGQPRNPTKFELSTNNFINSIINNEGKYLSIIDILKRNMPKIKGIKSGEKIINNVDSNEITSAISNLDNSYLYIQGPPGTGKSTYSAKTILNLLKKGKKIFVNANSHKVIHNLLKKVEEFAQEENFKFVGFKKSPENDPENQYDGKFIENVFGRDGDSTIINYLNQIDQGLIKTGCLVGGTKWLYSLEELDQMGDFLFIDEVGQLSIADIITIGQSAKNLVLIGDQNQLGQPIQADHPGNSGDSILDYLLEGKETIPENKGIFLNQSFRMRDEINDFISLNFYEGRLKSSQVAQNRSIDFKDSIINSPGINYIQMNHKNNVQTSNEEFNVISNILKNMIGLNFKDNGKERKLKLNDFLIVSPFNTQVNFLKSNLVNQGFSNVNVGTIDKFQGQEAPVVLISMVSSDPESIPRNKEFFFSKNRLNVAISRAQVSSIILFNPDLLKGNPTNVETMKLMNNFFKLTNYKKVEA